MGCYCLYMTYSHTKGVSERCPSLFKLACVFIIRNANAHNSWCEMICGVSCGKWCMMRNSGNYIIPPTPENFFCYPVIHIGYCYPAVHSCYSSIHSHFPLIVAISNRIYGVSGVRFNIEMVLPGIWIPMIKILKIMHELPWITIFWSRVRWFGNDFHEWRSHEWKIVGKSPHEWPKYRYSR